MGKEYEAQVLDINVTEMRKKLKQMKGKRVHKQIKMVRAVFHRCNSKITSFARVRDEGKDVTMTVKIYNDPKYPDEYEVTIKEDFEAGKKFLESLNLKMKSYQESFREKWSLPIKGVHEITFDTWPGLPTYMEIDCTTKNTLDNMINKLKIDKTKLIHGGTGIKYNHYYGLNINYMDSKLSKIQFKTFLKDLKRKPKKNKKLLEDTIKLQQKLIK